MPALTVRLREITHLRGDASPDRRWFASQDLDLIVWTQPNGRIGGFQPCHDKERGEKALTWRQGRGFVHSRVDAGEDRGGGHKGSPVLADTVPWDARRLLEPFAAAADDPARVRRAHAAGPATPPTRPPAVAAPRGATGCTVDGHDRGVRPPSPCTTGTNRAYARWPRFRLGGGPGGAVLAALSIHDEGLPT